MTFTLLSLRNPAASYSIKASAEGARGICRMMEYRSRKDYVIYFWDGVNDPKKIDIPERYDNAGFDALFAQLNACVVNIGR